MMTQFLLRSWPTFGTPGHVPSAESPVPPACLPLPPNHCRHSLGAGNANISFLIHTTVKSIYKRNPRRWNECNRFFACLKSSCQIFNTIAYYFFVHFPVGIILTKRVLFFLFWSSCQSYQCKHCFIYSKC